MKTLQILFWRVDRSVITRFVILSLFVSACASRGSAPSEATGTPAAEPAAQPGPVYSPFVVELETSSQSPLPFSVISFKDVGMSVAPENRVFEYELLAVSVAHGLAQSFEDAGPEVRHAPEVTAADQHLACEAGHIYVDLWSSAGGMAYSLWSGCGEDDRFAYRELAGDSAQILADDITRQLRRASDAGCFTVHC